ncbi:adenylate/guanylate cyclase domain-containing protein [Paenibacillus sp. YYML68]|uniref:adenylate/guanylate cyclase domain-containing protein n=1 Tax=Paenibacillus sp. YYML68 TaxID=2909250 RepID=UPI00248FA364|nr:adenylate/guanylate cyclase domain-containing protein [Paenibacillus sp. YYML68]
MMDDFKKVYCRGCWQQMKVPIFIRTPLSVPFRLMGIRPSRMHPNLCTLCESMFTRVKKNKQIDIQATVMFADLRGYTALSEQVGPDGIARLLNAFYDECAPAIWRRDGIINKMIGDAVLSIFNFPIEQHDHVHQAMMAGIEIQRKCAAVQSELRAAAGLDVPVQIGIGIHTGTAAIGEFGTAYKDFTIIGSVVNKAARLQGAAANGEILITEEAYSHIEHMYPHLEPRTYHLKGMEQPVIAYSVPV